MSRKDLGLLAVLSVIATAPLAAQENVSWPDRAFVTIDVSFQPVNDDFSEILSFADTVQRTENVNFLIGYPSSQGALFDAGGGVRLTAILGVGVTASWAQRSSSGSFEVELPNPLVANSPLELAGPIAGLSRNEIGVHIQAHYARGLGKNVRVTLSAGPSIFYTRQELVRSIDVDILPGFRSLRFDQADIAEHEQTSWGFNVGADITWAFARHFGIGTVTRYSRASINWKPRSDNGIIREIETHAGGLHIGGGVRLLF
jgi:hypothetical protein